MTFLYFMLLHINLVIHKILGCLVEWEKFSFWSRIHTWTEMSINHFKFRIGKKLHDPKLQTTTTWVLVADSFMTDVQVLVFSKLFYFQKSYFNIWFRLPQRKNRIFKPKPIKPTIKLPKFKPLSKIFHPQKPRNLKPKQFFSPSNYKTHKKKKSNIQVESFLEIQNRHEILMIIKEENI